MSLDAPLLGNIISHTIILAYREDTGLLEKALRTEGLNPEVQRANYSELEMTYSRTIRCLLNHAAAWKIASLRNGYTLIMESDFVPCRNFRSLAIPFDPKIHGDMAWAFLYAGGPRLFRVLPGGGMPGHAACPVAILISSRVAGSLVEVFGELMEKESDLKDYSLWDTIFQWHMMGKGATCFMPYRHYGEHGGIQNPEHQLAGTGQFNQNRLFSLLRFYRNHHAECLHGRLAFLPSYAKGSSIRYLSTRLIAKTVGFARLITGRVVMPIQHITLRERFVLYLIAFRRLLSLY